MKGVSLTNKQEPLLYRAPYVVPVGAPLIEDGGVLVAAGRIVAVDRFSRLRREPAQVVELDGRIITPALINCHAHLELSHLAVLGQGEVSLASAPLSQQGEAQGQPPPLAERSRSQQGNGLERPAGDITAWIRTLLSQRAESTLSDDMIIRAGQAALAALHRRGTALVADIGNQAASLAIGRGGPAECLFFHELLGLTRQAAEAVLAAVPDVQVTAHAPYSCHPHLLREVKERSRRAGALFPIHVAESLAEIEFLQTGAGPMHDFLAERLRLFGALAEGQALSELVAIPGCGAVEYLDQLGVLDRHTICVHTVHLSGQEADLLASTQARVCLCPGSNRRLGVGTAKVEWFLERQILPGLGTDSLASNDCLDLWQEMRLLQEDHPGLDPALIFTMATQGGAATLGVEQRLGTLAPGREAKLLAVAFSGPAAEVYPFLVNGGQAITLDWLEASHGH